MWNRREQSAEISKAALEFLKACDDTFSSPSDRISMFGGPPDLVLLSRQALYHDWQHSSEDPHPRIDGLFAAPANTFWFFACCLDGVRIQRP